MALFLAVLLLTSLGWSVTRDALTRREVRMTREHAQRVRRDRGVKAFCNDGSAAAGGASGDDDADDGAHDDSACNAYLLTECVERARAPDDARPPPASFLP